MSRVLKAMGPENGTDRYCTLKEHQLVRTFATVSKVSDISFIMGGYEIIFLKYFESFLRNKQRVVGNNIV